MKRHKYTFPRFLVNINKRTEITLLALKYLRDQRLLQNSSLDFCLRVGLRRNYIPFSKINTYCLATGRVRYTIKHTQTSRHVFFELCREGSIPGFFFAS